jgi:hypothetical protein
MTACTTYEIIAGFPHISLPKVTDEQTFEDLKIIRRLLNTNAMIVSSYEGGGLHGHLGIIMTNDNYFVVATEVFTAPANQGGGTIVVGMMAAQITETNRAHVEVTRI